MSERVPRRRIIVGISGASGAAYENALALDEGARSVRWGPAVAVLVAAIWAGGAVAGFQTSLLILTVLGFVALVIGLRYPAIGLLGLSPTLQPADQLADLPLLGRIDGGRQRAHLGRFGVLLRIGGHRHRLLMVNHHVLGEAIFHG